MVTVGPKSHVFGSVLGGFIETIGCFMSHVENSSSWGGWGVCDDIFFAFEDVWSKRARASAHRAKGPHLSKRSHMKKGGGCT